jgi:hypothetical protein
VIKTYPFPMYSPVSAAAMGLLPVEEIPIEIDVTRFYETQDLQTKKSRDRKDITLHMRLVCSGGPTRPRRADKSTSVDLLRIEPRSERIGTGEIRR